LTTIGLSVIIGGVSGTFTCCLFLKQLNLDDFSVGDDLRIEFDFGKICYDDRSTSFSFLKEF
jgi:hypothetical protein